MPDKILTIFGCISTFWAFIVKAVNFFMPLQVLLILGCIIAFTAFKERHLKYATLIFCFRINFPPTFLYFSMEHTI